MYIQTTTRHVNELSIDDIRPNFQPRKFTLTSRHIIFAASLAALLSLVPIGYTLSGYFDSELSPGNTFSAGVWDSQPPVVQVEQDIPLVVTLDEPQSFSVVADEPPADPPADLPPTEPADTPVIEVSEPVTTITEEPPQLSSQSQPDQTPPES